jgi:hypothetical protein
MFGFLRYFFLSVFLCVSFLGYTYFGPSSHTRFFTSQSWYRTTVTPFFEAAFSLSPSDGRVVAQLSSFRGDLTVRSQNEIIFVPARDAQALTAGTLVSSGEDSSAKITLIDNSVLTLEASSVVLIEAPLSARTNEQSITLKVIRGTVAAKKEKNSQVKVSLISSKGVVKTVSGEKKLVVIAQKKDSGIRKLFSTESKISELALPEEEDLDELIGTVKEDQDIKGLEKKLFNDDSIIASRVRSASQKMMSKQPENEIKLDELAEITSSLETQNQKTSEKDKGAVAPIDPKALEKAGLKGVTDELLIEGSSPMELAKEKELILSKRAEAAVKVASLTVDAEEGSSVSVKISEFGSLPKIPSTVKLSPESDVGPARKFSSDDFASSSDSAVSASEKESKDDSAKLASPLSGAGGPGAPSSPNGKLPKKLDRIAASTARSRNLRSQNSTVREIASVGFGGPTQAGMDALMSNFIQANNCSSALRTVNEVKRNYRSDPRVRSWVTKWAPIYNGACVPMGSSRAEISE